MKKLVIISSFMLPLMFATFSMNAQATLEDQIISKDEVFLEFTTAYDFEDLVEAKAKLKDLDIELTYTSLKFDDKGKLSQISAGIEYPDGNAGAFTSRELTSSTDGPGFRRKMDSEK